MSIALIVAAVFGVAYLLFLFGVLVLEERVELLTMLGYWMGLPMMLIGYIPFMILVNLWFWLTGRHPFGTGDCAHLVCFMFATPIGIAILSGAIALIEYFCGSYKIVPVVQ